MLQYVKVKVSCEPYFRYMTHSLHNRRFITATIVMNILTFILISIQLSLLTKTYQQQASVESLACLKYQSCFNKTASSDLGLYCNAAQSCIHSNVDVVFLQCTAYDSPGCRIRWNITTYDDLRFYPIMSLDDLRWCEITLLVWSVACSTWINHWKHMYLCDSRYYYDSCGIAS